MENDKKCAPSKEYYDGSCITKDKLIKIASKYNERNRDKAINLSLDKKHLVKELENRLKDQCDDQVCWLGIDYVKALKDEDLNTNTFRPKGPNKKYGWLSTNDIEDVVNQYQSKYKNFHFLGARPIDFEEIKMLGFQNFDVGKYEKGGKTKLGLVLNLDEHWKPGSHWVGLYSDLEKKQVYFFDSVGKKPSKRIRRFITRLVKYMYERDNGKNLDVNGVIKSIKGGNINNDAKNLQNNFDIRYNNIQHQFGNSECGVYSINFIVRLVRGETFDSIINDITKDEAMNSCRKTYFRNVN